MSGVEENSESNREKALLSWVQQFAPYGVLTLDPSFRIQGWNHWMETHSSLSVKEVIGKSIFAIFPEIAERGLTPPFERASNGEATVLSTTLHHHLLPLSAPKHEGGQDLMRQTARIAPLLSNGAVSGIIVVIEDVTQRERQAEALIRQHRRQEILSWILAHLLKSETPWKSMRQLFFKVAEHLDFDSFVFYLRDPETGVLTLYEAGGISLHAEKDFENYPLFTRLAQSREITHFNSIQNSVESDYSPLKNAGLASAVGVPLFANDRLLGLLCFASSSRDFIATDESDLLMTIGQYLAIAVDREKTSELLVAAKDKLANHAQDLEQMVEERTTRLQETITELEMFSYTLAHDLKAPVRGMIGFCNILLEDFEKELTPGVRRIVQRLAQTPHRMETLILNLLDFSKVSRQEVPLSRVEMQPIIENVLSMRGNEVRMAVTVNSGLHAVHGNKELLKQVIANLIDNAVKFVETASPAKISIYSEVLSENSPSTRSSPLLFSASEASPAVLTSVQTEGLNHRVRIWVEDQGIGIPAEIHQKIFGIFERGVNADLYEGTGMGLAIVARAMQRMRGTCGLESELGKGSRFWIELPSA